MDGSVAIGSGSVTTGTGGTSVSTAVTFVVGLAVEGVGGAVMPISPACAGGVTSVVMADTVEDKPTTVLSTDFSVTLASDVTNVCFVAAVDGAVA